MSLWLNDDELLMLTGYKRRKEQVQALAQLRVQFRQRPADGFPLVERRLFESGVPSNRNKEPNYG